jgi:hypothetical protein
MVTAATATATIESLPWQDMVVVSFLCPYLVRKEWGGTDLGTGMEDRVGALADLGAERTAV